MYIFPIVRSEEPEFDERNSEGSKFNSLYQQSPVSHKFPPLW